MSRYVGKNSTEIKFGAF